MTEDEIDALVQSQLPSWAIGWAGGGLLLGAQLPTLDGRRVGNGHIIAIEEGVAWAPFGKVYTVLTDAGSELKVTCEEIAELFYPPQWVSDVAEVLRKVKRTE